MKARTVDLRKLIHEVRRSFWEMAALADHLVEDLGLTASSRAVLEFLSDNGPATVPAIALAKSVRRQSIQQLVDRLRSQSLVTLEDNPAHLRSKLVRLSSEGKRIFAIIRTREGKLLEEMVAPLDGDALRAAIKTLRQVRASLEIRRAAPGESE